MSLIDRIKQRGAENKTRAAQKRDGGHPTAARARLLDVDDEPKPLPKPSGKFAKPALRDDAPYSDNMQNPKRAYVEIEVYEVKAVTARAALCDIGGDEVWLPLSEMYEPGHVFDKRGQYGMIVLPEWLAEEKGLA